MKISQFTVKKQRQLRNEIREKKEKLDSLQSSLQEMKKQQTTEKNHTKKSLNGKILSIITNNHIKPMNQEKVKKNNLTIYTI